MGAWLCVTYFALWLRLWLGLWLGLWLDFFGSSIFGKDFCQRFFLAWWFGDGFFVSVLCGLGVLFLLGFGRNFIRFFGHNAALVATFLFGADLVSGAVKIRLARGRRLNWDGGTALLSK
jgi:hypothetical protein